MAQTAGVSGVVRDDTGAPLPGVAVELRVDALGPRSTETDLRGAYVFDTVPAGRAQLSFGLVNFASARRDVTVPASGSVARRRDRCTWR